MLQLNSCNKRFWRPGHNDGGIVSEGEPVSLMNPHGIVLGELQATSSESRMKLTSSLSHDLAPHLRCLYRSNQGDERVFKLCSTILLPKPCRNVLSFVTKGLIRVNFKHG